jgi:DNA-binding NarL/FixJ family response regulator
MRKIKVILADDHTVVRAGLRALLTAEDDMEIIGEAENGRQAVQLARELEPNIVLMDVAMPQLNGLEATWQITRAMPHIRVLVLSSYGDDEMVGQMVAAGAAGYLLKQTATTELLKAIREVYQGNAYYGSNLARWMREEAGHASGTGHLARRKFDRLTGREAEVLQLIAEGLANKQIAAELSISIKTVEKHRQQVMNKLHIHDVAGLTRHALARGIIEPSLVLRPEPIAGGAAQNGFRAG